MNHHESTPTSSLTPKSIDQLDIDDDMREALERIKAIYETTESRGQHFQNLYAEGETEQLQTEIEDLAYDLMDAGDPEYQDLLKQRKADPKIDISKRVNEIAALYIRFITSEAGLPDEARFTEIEHAYRAVQTLYKKEFGGVPEDPQDAIKALGILQYDNEGKATYHFPHTIVPESVNEKWDVYLASVCAHLSADRASKDTGDKQAVEMADRTRKYAHDSVTRDVHAILGLQDIKGWDFQSTRRLLASVREAVFPTGINSAPEAKYASELLSHSTKQLRTTSALAHHARH